MFFISNFAVNINEKRQKTTIFASKIQLKINYLNETIKDFKINHQSRKRIA